MLYWMFTILLTANLQKPTATIKTSLQLKNSWKDQWPCASPIKSSTLPINLHQGYISKEELKKGKTPPNMYGNLELMKISNFLHLTWDHIKSHCEILKREFCTYLPKNDEKFEEILESDLPVEIKTVDYVYDSPTDFDERTNGVTLKVSIDKFKLSKLEEKKLISLLRENYCSKTNKMVIFSDKCPMRQQNIEYCFFLMRVLYLESKKSYDWEKENPSLKKSTIEEDIERVKTKFGVELDPSTENKSFHDYRTATRKIIDGHHSPQNEEFYKNAVKGLLNLS